MIIKYKDILATIGLVIICLTAVVHMTVYRSEYIQFKEAGKPRDELLSRFPAGAVSGELGVIDQYLKDKVGKLPIIEIELFYPDVMFDDESSEVIINYDALFSEDFDDDGNVKEPKISLRHHSIKLSSSDFSIVPEQQLDQESGTKVPEKLSWKISPDNIRSNSITIDFSKLLDTNELWESATIDFTDYSRKKQLLDLSEPYGITVKVDKYVPIQEKIFAWLQAISYILGLVLMIPKFIELMRKLNRNRTAPS